MESVLLPLCNYVLATSFLILIFIYLSAPGLSCGTWIFDLHYNVWNLLIAACGIFSCSMPDLIPGSGIEPSLPAAGVQSLSHWTPRGGPGYTLLGERDGGEVKRAELEAQKFRGQIIMLISRAGRIRLGPCLQHQGSKQNNASQRCQPPTSQNL